MPFNSELIRTTAIFLFISTCRFLISNCLHNTTQPRGLTPSAFTEFNFVRINRSEQCIFPRVYSPQSPRTRRATCIRFSISNFPVGAVHNATSLIQRTIYPGFIDKTYNTRIRKLPLHYRAYMLLRPQIAAYRFYLHIHELTLQRRKFIPSKAMTVTISLTSRV